MKYFRAVVVFLVLGICQMSSYAQSGDSEKYGLQKQKVLNVVINSTQFDSVYLSKKVYFEENELLSPDAKLNLRRKKKRVVIVEDGRLLKGKQYVVLGDFTTDRENMTTARVQLEVMPQGTLLNVYLVKREDEWIIHNHFIVKED